MLIPVQSSPPTAHIREATRAFAVVFVMERKMLLGIKERAERTHTAALRRAMQSASVEAAVHA